MINEHQEKTGKQLSTESSSNSYAVMDVETTGIYSRSNRIIEIAIVTVSDGEIEHEYNTLLNPKRDLGDSNIHGITSRDVVDAPTFDEIAGDVLELLRGRILVGHNVNFDMMFLKEEFRRINLEIPKLPHCCTMRLSYSYGPKQRKLSDCCAHFQIRNERHHAALEDARATAKLFHAYKEEAAKTGDHGWRAAHVAGDPDELPRLRRSGRTHSRTCNSSTSKPSYLAQLVSSLPSVGSFEHAAYYSILDRALEDRRLSEEEIYALSHNAQDNGLSAEAVIAAHREYLQNVVRTALNDGVINDAEQRDIEDVTNLLGFEKEYAVELVSQMRKMPKAVVSNFASANNFVGKKVCFTGVLTGRLDGVPVSRTTALELIAAKGMIPTDSLTKTTDILVVADPDTLSSKAEKARKYGTRIIAERAFWNEAGISID